MWDLGDVGGADIEACRCVFSLSVYNALSLRLRDDTVFGITNYLRTAWQPSWGSAESVVTVENVRAAAEKLAELGALCVDGDQLKVTVRDPTTHRGRMVGLGEGHLTLKLQ